MKKKAEKNQRIHHIAICISWNYREVYMSEANPYFLTFLKLHHKSKWEHCLITVQVGKTCVQEKPGDNRDRNEKFELSEEWHVNWLTISD